ncbi:hypothetical protein CSW72_27340, partial [Shigella boydii]
HTSPGAAQLIARLLDSTGQSRRYSWAPSAGDDTDSYQPWRGAVNCSPAGLDWAKQKVFLGTICWR